MEKEYNKIAKFYNAYAHTQNWLLEFVEDILVEKQIFSGNLVDFGCGSGVLFEYLENTLSFTGVDISQDLLNQALINAPHATYVHADITKFSTTGATVTTCLFDTLNHLETISEVYKTITNMYNSLNKDGVAIFDLFGISELKSINDQSIVTPVETEFGVAYFQATSDNKTLTWDIDAFFSVENDLYEKESVQFCEQYFDLDKILEFVSNKFNTCFCYNAAGERIAFNTQLKERTFFVCTK